MWCSRMINLWCGLLGDPLLMIFTPSRPLLMAVRNSAAALSLGSSLGSDLLLSHFSFLDFFQQVVHSFLWVILFLFTAYSFIWVSLFTFNHFFHIWVIVVCLVRRHAGICFTFGGILGHLLILDEGYAISNGGRYPGWPSPMSHV